MANTFFFLPGVSQLQENKSFPPPPIPICANRFFDLQLILTAKMAEQGSKTQLEDTRAGLSLGTTNTANRGRPGFVNNFPEGGQNQNVRDTKGQNQDQIVITGSQEEESGSVSCGKLKFQKKRIVVATVFTILLLAAIIVPIAVIFGRKNAVQPTPEAETTLIKFNEQAVPLGVIAFIDTSGSAVTMHWLMSSNVNVVEPFTKTIATCQPSGNSKQLNCEVVVPVIDIIDSIYSSEKEPSQKKWLNQYYKNSRSFVDNFQKILREALTSQNLSSGEKFSLLSIEQRTLVDVIYNNDKSLFEIGKYENNLEAEKELVGDQAPSTPDYSSWFDKILNKASSNLKKIIQSNLRLFRSKAQELEVIKKKFIEKQKIGGDWQNALISKCSTVNSRLFRCPVDATSTLVPGFKAQDVSQIPSDVITTSNLVLKIVQTLS